jgi:type I restriction enzyme S subunit
VSEVWENYPLQSLVIKVGSGSTPKGGAEAYKAAGIPLIRSMNVVFFGFKRAGLAYIDAQQAAQLDNATVKAGDVLLNITGASIGRVTLAPDEFDGARVNQHVCIIRPNDALDARFLNAYLSSPALQSQIWNDNFGVTRQALTKQQILDFEVPVPPRSEQTRIVNQLDTLLTRVQACNDRFDAIPVLLKRFRQTVLRAATSGELTVDWRRNSFGVDVVSDFTEVRVGDPYSHAIRAPKLWKESSLGAACDFVGGSQPPKSTFTYENGDDLVRLIQIRDYKSNRHITYIPKKLARRFCNKTDVMIGRYGPPIFQILRGLEGAYNVALMKAVPRAKDIDLEYLYVFLRGDQLLKFIEAGSDRTAGQDGVRKELLTPYPIFLPSLSEQAEIVRRVETLFALADRIEAHCTAARAKAQRLSPLVLAKAFRGELVPQDPTDEPASALLARIGLANTTVVGKNKRKVPVGLEKRA